MNAATSPTAPRWWQWRARLRQWWQGRLTAADAVLLTQRNVYILPTRAGLMLALTLGVLLIASINYQLNLGYLFTFLLAGCAAAGVWVGHGTLRGLGLKLLPPQPVFAGQPAFLDVRLSSARAAPRHAIGLAVMGAGREDARWAWADVPARGEAALQTSFCPARRGLHAAPLLVVQTLFPLGAFRIWTVWKPAAQVLAWPAPEVNAPPLPVGEARAGAGQAASRERAPGEFDGVRPWQRGDTLRQVVWKKFAKSGELVSRDAQHLQRQQLWLDFARTGAPDAESRLSRLAAWVLAADARQLEYGLRLPGLEIEPDSGAAHKLRCLRALALC
ncbi:hypothetical protein ADJ79_02265 [Ottowia sp. oral taxon 894]|uniref:DUF58 domain-containing protein n=2 Tax=Ottowia TaxID=219181 RepID=UPI00068077D4|nr:DUF58 domain-containing protein [Ottowia sp. oral taxon 894]AKU66349.1 hypothetical protein ADJ79_02265 [Ottowia sp. oral taxon 894]